MNYQEQVKNRSCEVCKHLNDPYVFCLGCEYSDYLYHPKFVAIEDPLSSPSLVSVPQDR